MRIMAGLQAKMKAAAANLDFEKAASLRDDIKRLRNADLGLPWPARRNLTACYRPSKTGSRAPRSKSRSTCDSSGCDRAASCHVPIYRHDIIEQFDAIGVGSLTVVLLTGFFTGRRRWRCRAG